MDANENDLMMVRDILVREIETINFYQRLLEQAQGDDAKNFLRHIIEEEKEHVAEALMLIKQYAPAQGLLFESGNHWRDGINAEKSKNGKTENSAAHTSEPQTRLTVGSLRKG